MSLGQIKQSTLHKRKKIKKKFKGVPYFVSLTLTIKMFIEKIEKKNPQ